MQARVLAVGIGAVWIGAFVAPGAAFVPASSVGRAPSLVMAEKSKSMPFLDRPAKLDGRLAGDVGFDPLGLSNIDDVGIDLYWLREAELKHCRLAMMAAAGVLWVELVGNLPGWPVTGDRSQTDVFWDVWAQKPQYVAAALLGIAIIEVVSGVATTKGRESGLRAPGDFGFNPLNLKEPQLKEVKNGRLAMFAVAGMIVQGLTTHQPALHNLFER